MHIHFLINEREKEKLVMERYTEGQRATKDEFSKASNVQGQHNPMEMEGGQLTSTH